MMFDVSEFNRKSTVDEVPRQTESRSRSRLLKLRSCKWAGQRVSLNSVTAVANILSSNYVRPSERFFSLKTKGKKLWSSVSPIDIVNCTENPLLILWAVFVLSEMNDELVEKWRCLGQVQGQKETFLSIDWEWFLVLNRKDVLLKQTFVWQ